MMNTPAFVVIFIILLAMFLGSLFAFVTFTISFVDHFKNHGYQITQSVHHPSVITHVWHDGEIIQSWYDTIESDSTAVTRKTEADQLINRLIKNEQ